MALSYPDSPSLPGDEDDTEEEGDLYAIDVNTHKPVWTKNVWKENGGGSLPRWVLTQNPLVYKNLLIVAAKSEAGEYTYSPGPDFVLEAGMTLIVIGESEAVQHLRASPMFTPDAAS